MTFNPANYREHFPILKKYNQLSSCSQSAMHVNVKRAVDDYMRSWEEEGMDWIGWVNAVEQARERFAALINADVEEIAVVSSVSHAASSIATSLEVIKDRDEIVVTEMDFPCIGHVWGSQISRGMKLQFIDSENNQIPLEKYETTINSKTLLTSISHVAYYNGFQQDIQQIAKIAHSQGSLLFVDAYQSAGNVKIDVKEMDVDFLAAGVQKYLLGIPGIAFLYIKKEHADKLTPRVTGWFGQENPFLFDVRDVTYAAGARRFDTGTGPMINGFAAKAALDLILEVGMDAVETHLKALSEFAIGYALEKGLTVRSPHQAALKGPSTAIYVKNASQVESEMKDKGVIVSARNDVIRIAPHFYNTKEDIQQAMDVLSELLQVSQ